MNRAVNRPTTQALSRRSGILAVALAAILGTALFAEPAHACPVCFDRDDEARVAFLATAGLLTLLPFGLVLGTGAWLRRRARGLGGDDGMGDGGDGYLEGAGPGRDEAEIHR